MLDLKDDVLSKIPDGSLKGATEFLEKLHWFLYVKESEGRIVLFKGDRPMFETDSMDAVEAFVYGALVAYRSLPEHIFGQFEKRFRDEEREHGPFRRPTFPRLKSL